MTALRVAPCSHEAARYAVANWHYNGLPTAKIVKLGAWEGDDERFLGVVLFSRGASPWLGTKLGLDQTELCELTRIALRDHKTPVSQIVARALTILRQTNPGLRLVVSFADPMQGHHGGVYQAGGWIFTGESDVVREFYFRGKWRHVRAAWPLMEADGADPTTVPVRYLPGKYRYLMPLDRATRRRILPLAKPYPSKADAEGARGRGVEGDPPDPRSGEPSSILGVRSEP